MRNQDIINQIIGASDTRDYLQKLINQTEQELTDNWQPLNDLSLSFSQLDYLWQLSLIECKIKPIMIDGYPKGGLHYYRKVQT